MFVETYRQENGSSMMAGGDARQIPYPKISQEDWRAWTLFLPVRSASIDPVHAIDARDISLHVIYGIPYTLTEEVRKAAQLFDNIEVWRKRDVSKDPIAVGVLALRVGEWKSYFRLKQSRKPSRLSYVELYHRTGRRDCRFGDDGCPDMEHVSLVGTY